LCFSRPFQAVEWCGGASNDVFTFLPVKIFGTFRACTWSNLAKRIFEQEQLQCNQVNKLNAIK
jgi:hypothetical protein